MAKKKKDDIENEDDINQDSQGDLGEADDNFGLPDVDYDPINREEESGPDTGGDPGYEPSSYGESEEETSEERSDIFAAEDTSREQEYIPGSYTPPKDDSIAPKIIAMVLILALAGAGIWYFGFYRPEQQRIEQAKIEKQRQEDARKQQEAAEAERKRQEELAAQREAEARAAEEAAKPKVGTIETISQRTGRYYVVISSAIDGDLAMDYAQKRKKEGVSTYILEPIGTSKFHRIAVSNFNTWSEAQAEADDLKGEFGDGVWVIKY